MAPPFTGNLTRHTQSYPFIDPSNFEHALKDKICLVTGAGRGIGKAIALAFAQAGGSVVFLARTKEEVDAARAEAEDKFGGKHIAIQANATSEADLKNAVEQTEKLLGTIDVVCCAAGTNTFEPFLLTESKDFWDLVEVNLRGPVDLTRIVLPGMVTRKTGCFIYVSSIAAAFSWPYTMHYNFAKSGLLRLASCMKTELSHEAPTPISFFSIHPGEVHTSLHDKPLKPIVIDKGQEVVELRKTMKKTAVNYSADLAAWTSVFLATGRADKLSGRFIDCTRDLEQLMARADEVIEKNLYTLKMDFL